MEGRHRSADGGGDDEDRGEHSAAATEAVGEAVLHQRSDEGPEDAEERMQRNRQLLSPGALSAYSLATPGRMTMNVNGFIASISMATRG